MTTNSQLSDTDVYIAQPVLDGDIHDSVPVTAYQDGTLADLCKEAAFYGFPCYLLTGSGERLGKVWPNGFVNSYV